MPGLMPTLNKSLRRRLAQDFTVVDVPEYLTTQRCSKCVRHDRDGRMKEERTRLIQIHDKKDPEKRRWVYVDVRGLRRCNNDRCGVFFSRDYNAAINMRLQLCHWIEHGTWHPAYARPAATT